jgi:hypothetical protein
VPIAIELFDLDARGASVRIEINGMPWTVVARTELPDLLAKIGRAYADGQLARLLSRSRADCR